jgi:hypothetical protein
MTDAGLHDAEKASAACAFDLTLLVRSGTCQDELYRQWLYKPFRNFILY